MANTVIGGARHDPTSIVRRRYVKKLIFY